MLHGGLWDSEYIRELNHKLLIPDPYQDERRSLIMEMEAGKSKDGSCFKVIVERLEVIAKESARLKADNEKRIDAINKGWPRENLVSTGYFTTGELDIIELFRKETNKDMHYKVSSLYGNSEESQIIAKDIIDTNLSGGRLSKPKLTKHRLVKHRRIKPKLTKRRRIKPKLTKRRLVKRKLVKHRLTK